MTLEYIKQEQAKINQDMQTLKKQSLSYSYIRFLCIAMVFVFGYIAYDHQVIYVYGFAIISFIAFVLSVYKHSKINRQMAYNIAYKEVYDDILARKNQNWKTFEDDGSDLINEKMTQAYDMDIFGKASLFQYVSVAKTPKGRELLAQFLSWKSPSIECIKQRQEAILECSENNAFMMHMITLSKLFYAHTKKRKKQTYDDIYEKIQDTTQVFPKFLDIASFVIPAIFIISVIGMIGFQWNYGVSLVCFTLNFIIALLLTMRSSDILSPVLKLSDVLNDYEQMLVAIQKQPLQSSYLKEIKQRIQNADKGIASLHNISQITRMRGSFLVNLIGNGLFLMDVHCVRMLNEWRVLYGNDMEMWLEQVGYMEALLSLCQIGVAKDTYVMPKTLKQDIPHINVNDLYHPLIAQQDAIKNNFQSDASTYIITGSNMSGKTTFLRTIGVNMILFQAGAHVCARSFEATPMNIFTSMRVHDNVSEGISTFYAEILRIRDMIAYSEKNEKMLVLIDEIFKGTNSADRIECAKQVIAQMHLPWVMTIVSTHDFELCALQQDNAILAHNYHFSEYYEDNHIHFDYLLKEGKCMTTNAKFLLQMAGITNPNVTKI